MIVKPFETKINLKNDGRLSLFFIGTGSAFVKNNFQNNVLIIKGDEHILVDCGTLCPFALETKYNTKITEIENVILTHPHADHIGGVEEMVLMDKYVRHSPVNIFIFGNHKSPLVFIKLSVTCKKNFFINQKTIRKLRILQIIWI